MRRPVHTLLLLCAWLFASGSHWDLVQTFAWGRMVATYAQGSSLQVAIQKTFDPDNWCEICETVNEAKRMDSLGVTGPKVDAKIVFLLPAFQEVALSLPEGKTWLHDVSSRAEVRRERPSTPPPRGLS